MTTLPLPLYQCQHTETVKFRGYKTRSTFDLSRCTLLATHLIGLGGKAAIRLCPEHAKEMQNCKFEAL